MAIFTDAELTEQITAWKAALLAVSSGQEYSMGDRRLRYSDLPEIRKTLEFLAAEQKSAVGTSRRVHTTPVGDSW